MILKQALKKYGEENLKKMSKSRYLQGITVRLNDKGEIDVPTRDYEIAYRDVIQKKKIQAGEWD